MKNVFATVFLFASFVLTATAEEQLRPTYPTNLAPSAQLQYQIKSNHSGISLTGKATINWQVTDTTPDKTYSITSETRAALFGKILEANSAGRIDSFGLAPNKYEEKPFNKSPMQTTFDRKAKQIRFSESDNIFPIKGGEQDRTSAIWQLVNIARASPTKFVPKSRWSFFVAGRRDVEKWTFVVEKKVSLSTLLGKITTIHLSKVTPDQRIDIWLAPGLEWYPVRIQFRDQNGDTIDQNLESINK